MKARITMSVTEEGELEIWLNEAGRAKLVEALLSLGEASDHFHFGPPEEGELEVLQRPYRPTDTVLGWGKVLYRTDEWDRRDFPHVIDD